MVKKRIRLLAHNIRSLWNVGSFFRTGDAFGVEMIHLTGYTGAPPRKEISKTALGAEEWIPWTHDADPLARIAALKGDGWTIVALELTPSARDVREPLAADKVCLVLGHEVDGVSDTLLSACDSAVMIPMRGRKESLNVAVAVGVALHALSDA